MAEATEAAAQAPWEPPLAGSEVEHLLGALNRLRTTFRWKTDDLDAEGLSRTVGASALTLGNLLKHLACAEDEKFGMALSGAAYGPPWAGMVDFDGSPHDYMFSTDGMEPAELYGVWDVAVRRSDQRLQAALEQQGLDQRVALGADEGLEVSLRRLLYDLVEEYGRHTGHADLLREAVDGRVGEDPPQGWSAVSGNSPVGVPPGK
ncbi:DUF664 domain-containing protein [Pseudactinotalea sp. Z1739]|uniref:mycothiol transferase n=1 Tax=Pseudactinotalea sp. Z1739 TaxID=3413028 RepID=UPI003C79B305